MLDREAALSLISAALAEGRLTVFAGAGISLNSGLPSARDFTSRVLSAFGLPSSDVEAILGAGLPFELFYQIIRDQSAGGDETLLNCFRASTPTRTHRLLARLAQRGGVNSLVTTNFDQLIERALLELGYRPDDVVVCSDPNAANLVYGPRGKVVLFKLHGSVDAPQTMAITLRQVAARHLAGARRDLLTRIIHEASVLLVIGYSCSDAFDISPVLEQLAAVGCKIVLIEHTVGAERVARLPEKPDPNPFRHYGGIWLRTDTDKLVAELWERHIEHAVPPLEHHEGPWRTEVDHWANAIVARSKETRLLIAARLFFEAGNFEQYAHYAELGIAVTDSTAAKFAWLGNLGNACSGLGRYDDSERYFSAALTLARDVADENGEMKVESGFGSLMLAQNRNAEAATHYERALALATATEHDQRRAIYLANAASAYICIGESGRADELLTQALALSGRLGDQQGVQHAIGLRGQYYSLLGDHPRAVSQFEEAIKLGHSLGDQRLLGAWYKNLADALFAAGDPTRAKAAYENAIPHTERALGSDHEDVLTLRRLLSTRFASPDT